MKPSTREILERYDEFGAYEFPGEFRYPEMEARAKEVARQLEAKGHRITFEDALYNQDASFSVALVLHTYEELLNRLLPQPTVRLSNFGNLASVAGSGQVPESDLNVIVQELEKGGFIYISESELDCDYDGVMSDKKFIRTWWIRYFDWL